MVWRCRPYGAIFTNAHARWRLRRLSRSVFVADVAAPPSFACPPPFHATPAACLRYADALSTESQHAAYRFFLSSIYRTQNGADATLIGLYMVARGRGLSPPPSQAGKSCAAREARKRRRQRAIRQRWCRQARGAAGRGRRKFSHAGNAFLASRRPVALLMKAAQQFYAGSALRGRIRS